MEDPPLTQIQTLWASIDLTALTTGYVAAAVAFIGFSLIALSYYKGRGIVRKG